LSKNCQKVVKKLSKKVKKCHKVVKVVKKLSKIFPKISLHLEKTKKGNGAIVEKVNGAVLEERVNHGIALSSGKSRG
jgi:hypothetical protein